MAELITPHPKKGWRESIQRRGSYFPRPSILLGIWLPALLIAASVLLPIAYLLVRASQANSSIWDLLLRTRTLEILTTTLWLGFSVTMASIIIAVPLAWLTTRSDVPYRQVWTVLTPLPLVIPSFVGAYLFVSTLGPRGLIQGWLEPFGVLRLPSLYGYPGAFLVLTMMSYPFVLLSTRAALQRMDPALEEAARSLGRNSWSTFWTVTLPQLRPSITAGSLLVALYVLRDFGAVSILRYNTFTRAIYMQYQNSFDRATAAALALVLVALTCILLIIEMHTRGRVRYYGSSAKSSRPPTVIVLGRWRWPAFVFCAVIVTGALVMPAGNLLFWLLRGLHAGQTIIALWIPAQNSILGAGLAAVGAILAALPITILDVRHPGRASRALERISYMAFALPGVVIALALVFFGTNFALFLYQTLPMLVIAYVLLFLPEAVGAIRSSLLQVHPNMEEAARGLGHNSISVFRRVTLPMVRPGISAGAALVFLTAMKELPATLILAPYGFSTLATGVWSAVSEAFFAQAAAPALLIILISSVPLAFILLRENSRD